jgi:hypothetical protein
MSAMTAGEAHAQSAANAPSAEQRLEILEGQIKAQQAEIDTLKQQLHEQDDALATLRGRGLADQGQPAASPPAPPSGDGASAQQASTSATPPEPVGEAPSSESEQEQLRTHVAAVPEGQGVLTPRGTFVFEPSLEYVQSSTDRLV